MSGGPGGVNVVILPNRDHAGDDPANRQTHVLFFRDGSSTSPRPPAERASAEPRERPRTAGTTGSRSKMTRSPSELRFLGGIA
jgi:hypothetical protein